VGPFLVAVDAHGMRVWRYRIPAEAVGLLRNLDPSSGDHNRLIADRSISKYDPLIDWMLAQTADVLPLTFTQVEDIVGFELARSARKHLPYWYSVQNSMGRAIAAGGYKATRVELS